MRSIPPVRAITALFLGLTLAACSGNPDPGTFDGGDSAVVVVDASGTFTSNMSVYMVPETGVRERLGIVTGDETERFTVSNVVWSDRFRLVGEAADGDEIVSNPFSIAPGQTVTWDVDLNSIVHN